MPQPHFVKIYKKRFSGCLRTQNLPFLSKNTPKQGKKSEKKKKNNYPVGKIKFPSWKIDFFQLGVFRLSTGRLSKITYKSVFSEFVKNFSDTEFSLSQCLIPKPSFRLLCRRRVSLSVPPCAHAYHIYFASIPINVRPTTS